MAKACAKFSEPGSQPAGDVTTSSDPRKISRYASGTAPVRSTTASAIAALEVSLATRASLARGGARVELA